MPSLAVRVSGELVFRGLEHELYGRRQPVNGVDAAEVAEINHRAQLLIAVKKWDFQPLYGRYERVPLINLNVRPDYISEIEEKQELAERHGAPRAFVVLRNTKFNKADLVDDVKIRLRQLHTHGDGRGARALAVVQAAVAEYGEGSVSACSSRLGVCKHQHAKRSKNPSHARS